MATDRAADSSTPDEHPHTRFRASHADRQLVADRLREALDEGRLTLDEYDNRLKEAYEAATYADLNALLRDIPTQSGVLEIRPPSGRPIPTASPAPAPRAPRPPAPRRRIPLALSILWTIWGAAVAINVVVWLIVMVTTGHFIYPWPIWVAGPSGAALLAVTAGVQAIRSRPDHD